METFEDDSLDDLLRDSSSRKFNKTALNAPTDLPSSGDPLQSKLEKKSALLAELFGPTSLSDIDSKQDAGKKIDSEFRSNKYFSF